MTDFPTLSRAPLIEALVDIHVTPPDGFDAKQLELFQSGLEARFPERREMNVVSMGFQQEVGKMPEGLPFIGNRLGFQLLSSDKAVQARLNGFTFSRLNGYDSWSTFLPEARELWNRYVRIVQPTSVTRIALRYINRINVPVPGDYADYFATVPQVAPLIDKGLASFLMRLVMPQDKSIIAGITLMTQPVQQEATEVPVIFDIDVFKEQLTLLPDEDVWLACEELRVVKNNIFFNSITEKALEAYK